MFMIYVLDNGWMDGSIKYHMRDMYIFVYDTLMMMMVITHANAVHPSNTVRCFDDTLYQWS